MSNRPNRTATAARMIGGLCALLLAPALAQGQTLAFAQASYTAERGQTLVLVTAFSSAVPNGLEGYSLRMEFPAGVLALSPSDIAIPAALDHDLFQPGAAREVTASSAAISGFVEFGQPAYTGTAFATFTVSIPVNAPLGVHQLQLLPHLPGGNSFVDGAGNGIDTVLVFGAATLEVTGSGDPPPAGPPPVLQITIESGGLRVRFDGTAGQSYALDRSPDLSGWTEVQTFAPAADGPLEYLDTDPLPAGQGRFYRARTPAG